ncbi:MAG: response regulator [Cyanobacteria bacterium REEB67]|nr:response regulator [Cyanobacteria bacterium REEB67]
MPIDTVLLVDDNAEYKKVVSKALEALTAWRVVTGSSGFDALNLLRESQTAPDVILMDVSMPYMDGLEAIQKIQQDKDFARIPIILVTAKVLDDEMAQYKTLGIAGIVSKPFDPLVLHKRVEQLCLEWQGF